FGFPRMGIEAEASSWNDRLFQGNMAFADGRVLNGAGKGPPPSPLGKDGRPTVLGAGPIVFRCVEPFRRWTMTFDGPAFDCPAKAQIARTFDPNKRTPVKPEAELTMVAPAWSQQTAGDNSLEAQFMGVGCRFEQLFRAEGSFEVDGKKRPFKG